MKRLILINPKNIVTLYGDYRWQPLSLAYIAAATPEGWEVRLLDEQFEPLSDLDIDALEADLVGITAFTTQVTRAYEIAARLRTRGVKVVLGGIHATLVRDEAERYADTIVAGEGETVWPQLIADFEQNRLQPFYEGENQAFGPKTLWPDRSIFSRYDYAYAAAQTSRGCPMGCSFCSVTAFNGRSFRMRDVEDVVAELGVIRERDLLLVDDDLNGFSRLARERCVRLMERMDGFDKRWITQVTINFGDDDELPRLARKAGCAGVFIGLEATDTPSLKVIRKDGRSHRRGTSLYRENIARIHAAGIGVVGSFILGIDTQKMDRVVEDILEFAEDVALDGLNPTVLTPLPGTDDYRRMLAAGRILFTDYPKDWERYTLAFPVHSMPHTTGAGLMRRYFEVLQFFRPDNLERIFHRTARTVSLDAAEHVWLWNRTWANYALARRLFRKSPMAAEYPSSLPWTAPSSDATQRSPHAPQQ